MARRQHDLGENAVSVDTAGGTPVSYDHVRLSRYINYPALRRLEAFWEIGRTDGSDWVPSTAPGHSGLKVYEDSDYDTLIGESTPADLEDRIYLDLVSDGAILGGTQENYPA